MACAVWVHFRPLLTYDKMLRYIVMIKWITIVAFVFSGLILWFLFQGLSLNPPTSAPPSSNTITIMHAYKDGVHRYIGALRLPHSCYDQLDPLVSSNAKMPNSVILSLTTRDKMLDPRLCFQITTTYPFEAITDAPEDAKMILRVNGESVPVNLVETAWQDPRGTILNLENNPK